MTLDVTQNVSRHVTTSICTNYYIQIRVGGGEETINGLEGGARIRVILVLVQEIHDDYGWWPHIITKNYFDKDLVSLV